ncbi:MAG: response regulator [Desulfobacteraceae bacterium]|nr:response regulator [Desulfobacteraceae bacterium]
MKTGRPVQGGLGYLEEGAKTALLCESNSDFHTKLRTALENIGYKVLSPAEPREALKQLRFHDFNVVVLNEMFGTRNPDVNHVHKHLSQLPMHSRRNIFVSLISERFKTGDNMQTFNKSVNQIINVSDIDRVEKVLKRGINENETFYRVMKESVAKIKG